MNGNPLGSIRRALTAWGFVASGAAVLLGVLSPADAQMVMR